MATSEKKTKTKIKGNFVLFVGEDGAVLTYHEKGRVERRLFSPSPSEQATDTFTQLFNEFPHAPIAMLVDVMDQSYTKHTLPPVSSLGVKKIIERRLARDYDPNDITGSLPLGREKTGRKDWNFLLISLSYNEIVRGWCELLYALSNRFTGVYLVPVECEYIINRINQRISASLIDGNQSTKKTLAFLPAKKDKKVSQSPNDARWDILIIHHKTGGIRQVVLKNGQLVFTRLTQEDSEEEINILAGNIEQETRNTLEYLRRLSFSDSAHLNIMFVLGQMLNQAISTDGFGANEVHRLTPHEAASLMGLEKSVLSGDRFGDVLMSSIFNSMKKKRLHLATQYLSKAETFAKSLMATKMVTILGALGLIGFAAMMAYDGYDAHSQLGDIKKQQTVANARLSDFESNADTFNVDPLEVDSLIRVHDFIVQDIADFNRPLTYLAHFISNELVAQQIHWKLVNKETTQQRGTNRSRAPSRTVSDDASDAKKEVFEAQIELDVYEDNQREFLDRWDALFADMVTHFDGYALTRSEIAGLEKKDDSLNINFEQQQSAFQSLKSSHKANITLTATSLDIDTSATTEGR